MQSLSGEMVLMSWQQDAFLHDSAAEKIILSEKRMVGTQITV